MVIIEPIKNQYLTALKERQQIIDKLNEIISGLNALNFDDLTTIQAELVAIRESLQTQNTAITEINNSIGQIETELTSFDNRLITLNTNIEDTKSNLNSFENDTALNLQSKVNKNGDTMTGNLGIPTTETGTRNNLAVNGERLQNDLDNYSFMLRTVGTFRNISGIKEFNNLIVNGLWNNKDSENNELSSTWIKVYESKPSLANQTLILLVSPAKLAQDTNEFGILMAGGSPTTPRCRWMIVGNGIIKENFVTVGTDNNTMEIWVKNQTGNRGINLIKLNETNWGSLADNWIVKHDIDSTFVPTSYPYYEVSL